MLRQVCLSYGDVVMKRILCVLLSLFIFLSTYPFSAFAQTFGDELCDGIVYTVNSKTGEVTIKGSGEIPDFNNSPFLYLNGDIRVVNVESGILKIGARLFRNCTSLEKINIGESVIDIDNTAFDGCVGIKEFNVDIENMVYSSFDGVLYSKDLSRLIKYPPSKTDERFVTLKNTVTISKDSFKYSQHLKTLVLSSETTDVEENFDDSAIAVKKERGTPSGGGKHRHEPVYKTVFPTCTEFGYIEYTCRTCDIRYINKYYCPTGHRLVERITPATTETVGHRVMVCTVCGQVEKDEIIDKIESSVLEYPNAVYNRCSYSPNVCVLDSKGNELVCGEDYILSIPLGRRYVGMYSYDIAFIGKYSGIQRLMFFVYPKSPLFRKIILRKNEVELCWDKITAQCDGYEVFYSKNPQFLNSTVIDVNNKNAKGIKLHGLKSKQIYYYKIRSYKIVNEGDKFYSSWSEIGKAKTL